jgi:crossover junction endodeoxyribonuclease RuvC
LVDVIGIDPGISGAIARYNPSKAKLDIWDMPILEVNKKKTISPYLVADILKEAAAPVYIEKVAAMPGQGVTSMFNFGKGFGVLLGAAAGLGLQTTQVTPQTWMKALKCQKGKDANRQRACELFPQYSHLFSRKKDDGRADAALLAYYAISFVESVD